MEVKERVALFRTEMRNREIDIAIVLTADPHHSEYLPDAYKTRRWLSGFTGSAGTLVITADEAVLFTDGRYFIQAERELQGSGIELMRMRVKGVPTLEEYIESRCREGIRIGTDFSLLSEKQMRIWAQKWNPKGAELVESGDLFAKLWTDRPQLPKGPAEAMPDAAVGETAEQKIARIRKAIGEKGAKAHILSVLDEIAWVLNVRGSDVMNTPVVISYLVIGETSAVWYVDTGKVSEELQEKLAVQGVQIRPYTAFLTEIRSVLTEPVYLDPAKTTASVYAALQGLRLVEGDDPAYRMKAVKNETEQAGIIESHRQDGIAVTRFMYWLKENVGRIPMTEVSVSEVLEGFRAQQPDYISPSFETICAYGPNAAMMHYKARAESCAVLEPQGFLLIDSGGQYTCGTTDITRTFVLGPVTQEQKVHFTAVLSSVIRLARARFLEGMAGKGLDILARGPIWDLGIDYRCGTGHGVGFRLNVHEGPNSFRWQESPSRGEETPLEPGMITTDEPGIYLEGKYGIRTENEILCKVREENEYGRFLEFETITYVPVDLDAVLPEAMSGSDREWLNRYHEMVYTMLEPEMQNDEERGWLRQATRPI